MKKFLGLVLALTMIFSLTTVANAAVGTGPQSHEVYLTVIPEAASAPVYSIDITWDDKLEFVYNKGQQGSWQPGSHNYTATTGATWEDGGIETVKVVNHSNAEIKYSAVYTADSSFADAQAGVSIKFKVGDDEATTTLSETILGVPELNSDQADAPSGDFKVVATGTPTKAELEKTKIGSVTLTIAPNA